MTWILYACHLVTHLLFGLWLLQGVAWHFSGNWAIRIQNELPIQKILIWAWIPCLVTLMFFFPWPQFHGRKALYFNSNFVAVRLIAYFGLALFSTHIMPKLPSLALIFCFLVGNFFAFDLAMSLEGDWSSSMYGMLYLANAVLITLAIFIFKAFPRLSIIPKVDLVHLLLVAVLFWAYLHFCQYLIIWMGNLPREISFYLHRSPILIEVILALKLIPIVLVSINPAWKRRDLFVKSACILISVASLFEIYWLVRFP